MHGRRSLSLALGAALTVLLASTACEGRVRAPVGGDTGEGATFTMACPLQVMTNWDPATSQSNEIIAMANVYEQLTRYDATAKTVVPLLATSWESRADGLTWTFHLRGHATFHTGRPVTAAAAEDAIERTIQLAAGAAYIWSSVQSIAAPDDVTLVFTLKYPAPLDLIASSSYGAYIYDTQAAKGSDLGDWFASGNEAGTGPYRAVQWNKGQEIELRLAAYAMYWGGWNGEHFSRMVFQVVPEATTAAQLLQSGEVSYAGNLTPQLWRQAALNETLTTVEAESFQNLIAMLNTRSGAFTDERVRRAVMLALDYEGLRRALFGSAAQASGFVPPGLLGHRDGLGPDQNVDEARKLLDQAGYGPGRKRLTLTLTRTEGDNAAQLTATVWKSNLADLGIDLQVRGLAWESQWDKAKSPDLGQRQDIFLFYWFPDYADPISWFVKLFHTEPEPSFNLSYFSDPQLDEQVDALPQLTATDRSAADKTYVQLQETLLRKAVAVPVLVSEHQRAHLRSIGGYVDNPAYSDVVFGYDLKPGGAS
jgi:peptide/nickel transport system substrate-binding protein